MQLVARLGDGVTVDQERDRMNAAVTALREQHPDHYKDSGILLVPQNDAGIHPQFRTAQVGLSSVVMAVVVMRVCGVIGVVVMRASRHELLPLCVYGSPR